MFDAHRARPHHLQGAHIHAVHAAAWKARSTIRGAADKLRRDALCLAFHRLGTCRGQHRGLGRQKLRDPVAQHPPVLPVHGKVASQVEQGLLADLYAVTPGAHQAVGKVRLAIPGPPRSITQRWTNPRGRIRRTMVDCCQRRRKKMYRRGGADNRYRSDVGLPETRLLHRDPGVLAQVGRRHPGNPG